MDDSEVLKQIQSEVEGSTSQLDVIVERSEHIDRKVTKLDEKVNGNAKDIDDLQSRVKRNTTIINIATAGIGAVGVWVMDKLSKLKIL
jgi:uncharacterized protein YoxC